MRDIRGRLGRWLEEAAPGATASLSREEVEALLTVLRLDDEAAGAALALAFEAEEAHAKGGPKALARALGFQEYDARQQLTYEEASEALVAYCDELAGNGGSAQEAAEWMVASWGQWRTLDAFRGWLRRQVEELRHADSPLWKTALGSQLDPNRIPIPHGRERRGRAR